MDNGLSVLNWLAANHIPLFEDASTILLKGCLLELNITVVDAVWKLVDNGAKMPTHIVNSFISAYAKCNNMAKAAALFEKEEHKTVVSWNTMINAYTQH